MKLIIALVKNITCFMVISYTILNTKKKRNFAMQQSLMKNCFGNIARTTVILPSAFLVEDKYDKRENSIAVLEADFLSVYVQKMLIVFRPRKLCIILPIAALIG